MKLSAVPFPPEDFAAWLENQHAQYAREKVQNGTWSEADAPERARRETEKLLPHGLATAEHRIRRIEDASTHALVAWIWLGPPTDGTPDLVWLYDVEIVPAYRGKGHGRAVMQLAETEARAMGYARLGLHVFAHNAVARHLYQSCGFEDTDFCMTKSLD